MSVISNAIWGSGVFGIPPGVYQEIADAVMAAGWKRDSDDPIEPWAGVDNP